jgi:pyruvate dehydrogenase E1 component alpha subunit
MADPAPNAATEGRPAEVDAIAVTKDQLLGWYEQMLAIRRVEELAAKAYTQRKILGFCHLYIGQEAVAVGATAALRPGRLRRHRVPRPRPGDGQGGPGARGHGRAVRQGHRGGPGHRRLDAHGEQREVRLLGGYGIVGGHVPLAAGAAFAAQYRGEDRVSLCYFGDGAAHQGAFFEALALRSCGSSPRCTCARTTTTRWGRASSGSPTSLDMSRRGDGVGMRRWQFQGFDVARCTAT